jgi:cytochrome c peroxidase
MGRTLNRCGVVALAVLLCACGRERPTAPASVPLAAASASPGLARLVRQLAAERGIGPLARPAPVRPALVRLGQALFFDRILSGNRDIACSTCHFPRFGTGDGKSLSVGQGGTGLGPERSPRPGGVFIPRNAPPLFNLAAMDHLFWDGRVFRDADGRVHTPAGEQLTPEMRRAFEFGAVSALGLLPPTSRTEMRGFSGNELAELADEDFTGIWRAEMARLRAIPEYVAMFRAAYPGTPVASLNFAHASNAIAGFMVDRMSFTDTPWDRLLAGDDDALSDEELFGAKQFLSLRCSICHSGATFSDGQFHNVALAQIGPGQGDGSGGTDDFGRMRVTGDPADRYRFRTTPLRNVELTAPYGHAGEFVDLRAFIDHYSESDVKLMAYDAGQLEPLLRGTVIPNQLEVLAHRDTLLDGVVIPSRTVEALRVFMRTLTDPAARRLDWLVPARVPSGLPVDRMP